MKNPFFCIKINSISVIDRVRINWVELWINALKIFGFDYCPIPYKCSIAFKDISKLNCIVSGCKSTFIGCKIKAFWWNKENKIQFPNQLVLKSPCVVLCDWHCHSIYTHLGVAINAWWYHHHENHHRHHHRLLVLQLLLPCYLLLFSCSNRVRSRTRRSNATSPSINMQTLTLIIENE